MDGRRGDDRVRRAALAGRPAGGCARASARVLAARAESPLPRVQLPLGDGVHLQAPPHPAAGARGRRHRERGHSPHGRSGPRAAPRLPDLLAHRPRVDDSAAPVGVDHPGDRGAQARRPPARAQESRMGELEEPADPLERGKGSSREPADPLRTQEKGARGEPADPSNTKGARGEPAAPLEQSPNPMFGGSPPLPAIVRADAPFCTDRSPRRGLRMWRRRGRRGPGACCQGLRRATPTPASRTTRRPTASPRSTAAAATRPR